MESLRRRVAFFRNNVGSQKSSHRSKTSLSVTLLTALSFTFLGIALILSMLCIFAGHKPGMMEDYAIFTLNTSRLGENLRKDLDTKISSVHFKRDVVALPVITAAPTTFIPQRRNDFSNLKSGFDSDKSKLTSKIHTEVSHVESVAHSDASAVVSHATSALGAAESDIVKAVNEAYDDIISDLGLKDFYSVHMITTCSGEYVYANGSNIIIGQGPLPDKGTHKHVDSCSTHSFIDPMQLIKIVYIIGAAHIVLAILLSVACVVTTSRKLHISRFLVTAIGFCFIGLASAVTHGISLGAAKLVDFIGEDIGVEGYKGGKFIAMTWTATVLMLIELFVLGALYVAKDKTAGRMDRTSEIVLANRRPVTMDDQTHQHASSYAPSASRGDSRQFSQSGRSDRTGFDEPERFPHLSSTGQGPYGLSSRE